MTAPNPLIGYTRAAEIARQAHREGRPIIDMAAELTDMRRADLVRLPGSVNALRADRCSMEAWKQLTTEDNFLFETGRLHAALERHVRAPGTMQPLSEAALQLVKMGMRSSHPVGSVQRREFVLIHVEPALSILAR